MKDFTGKVAVITGAGSGFGREFARIGARLGMKLALADGPNEICPIATSSKLSPAAVAMPVFYLGKNTGPY